MGDVTLVVTRCPNAKFRVGINSAEVLDVQDSATDVASLSFAFANPLDIRNGHKKCTAIRHLMLCGFQNADVDVLELSISSPIRSFPVLKSVIVEPEA